MSSSSLGRLLLLSIAVTFEADKAAMNAGFGAVEAAAVSGMTPHRFRLPVVEVEDSALDVPLEDGSFPASLAATSLARFKASSADVAVAEELIC